MTTSSPAARRLLADGHVDLPYALENRSLASFTDLRTGPVTAETLTKAGVGLLVCALYCADRFNGSASAWPNLQRLLALSVGGLGPLRPWRPGEPLAAGPGEPPRYLRLIENGDGLLEADLDLLENDGVRAVGLTHAGSNRLADGNGVPSPSGLRPAARRLLAQLQRRRWIVDLAHLAEPGFWELLERFDGPVMTSHTGLRRFCDRPRNLGDEQLQAIVSRRGMIGLSLAPEMLTGTTATRTDVLRQLDWLLQRFGPESVAIGSDYCGFDGECRGLEDYRIWRLLESEMLAAGYPEATVAEILGGNWLRFYRDHLSGVQGPGE